MFPRRSPLGTPALTPDGTVSPNLAAELAALVVALRAVAAQVAALVEDRPTEPVRWLTTSEAAELAHIGSAQSVRNWAKKYGLGFKVRDRWQIDRCLLDDFLRDRAHGADQTRASLRSKF